MPSGIARLNPPNTPQDKASFVLVINGIDRLVVELKLPPTDAYHKLRYCIEDLSGGELFYGIS